MRPPLHPVRRVRRRAPGQDPLQQEGHRPHPDGRATPGPPSHEPPGQGQAVGEGHEGYAKQTYAGQLLPKVRTSKKGPLIVATLLMTKLKLTNIN